jgi:hypothetical protein
MVIVIVKKRTMFDEKIAEESLLAISEFCFVEIKAITRGEQKLEDVLPRAFTLIQQYVEC